MLFLLDRHIFLNSANYCQGQETVDLHIHSPIHLHGVVLSKFFYFYVQTHSTIADILWAAGSRNCFVFLLQTDDLLPCFQNHIAKTYLQLLQYTWKLHKEDDSILSLAERPRTTKISCTSKTPKIRRKSKKLLKSDASPKNFRNQLHVQDLRNSAARPRTSKLSRPLTQV
jgi:hypothetical protein